MSKSNGRKPIANKAENKRRGNPKWVKGGPSPNPRGRPAEGESWATLIKRIGDLTPKAAADYAREVVGQLAKLGDRITIKEAVILRVYAALLFEPDARLLNAFMDRAEGKITQSIDLHAEIANRSDNELVTEFRQLLDAAAETTGRSDPDGTEAAPADADPSA